MSRLFLMPVTDCLQPRSAQQLQKRVGVIGEIAAMTDIPIPRLNLETSCRPGKHIDCYHAARCYGDRIWDIQGAGSSGYALGVTEEVDRPSCYTLFVVENGLSLKGAIAAR